MIAGETGKPITITPLANDLPGADPLTPDAVLTPRRRGRQRAGRRRDHQPRQGHHHAALARRPRPTSSTTRRPTAPPTPTPARSASTCARRRTRPSTRSPSPTASPCSARRARWSTCWPTTSTRPGGLLSVQRAEPLAANQLDVAVVDGRWLRVSARQGQLVAQPPGRPLHDQQRPPARASPARWSSASGRRRPTTRPVTQNDDVTVREGSSQAIPVLDNDFSPSGGTLTLVSGRRRALRPARRAAAGRARRRHRGGVRVRPHRPLRRPERTAAVRSGSPSATR